jgi:hypothetical protein
MSPPFWKLLGKTSLPNLLFLSLAQAMFFLFTGTSFLLTENT